MRAYIVYRITDNRDIGGKLHIEQAIFKSFENAQDYRDSLSRRAESDKSYSAIANSVIADF